MVSPKRKQKDYYAILSVAPDATATVIKESYRALVQRYHPDRVRGSGDADTATERMFEINEAFSVLSNKQKRAEFDLRRIAETAPPPRPAPPVEPAIDYEALRTPSGRQETKPNPELNEAVTNEFLDALKKSVAEKGATLKLKEEKEKSWRWSFSGGSWSKSYWIALRQVKMLNTNSTRELLAQVSAVIRRRGSLLNNTSFIFILGMLATEESDHVFKICRAFCGENKRVHIVLLDLVHRRSTLFGRGSDDPKVKLLLKAVGAV